MKPRIFALVAIILTSIAVGHASIKTSTLAYAHEGTVLKGVLFYDDTAAAPQPGILIVHEWWGINDNIRTKAESLAQMGYAVFALDMYGDGLSVNTPDAASKLAKPFYGSPLMATRARAGLDAFIRTARVDADRIAVIGFCFGGTTAQALAYSGAPVRAAVSFHGNPLNPPVDAAKTVTAKFLILHGAADPMIKPADMAAYREQMNASGLDWQLIEYGGAVHSFTNPAADSFGIPGVAYNQSAHTRSWGAMLSFFGEALR